MQQELIIETFAPPEVYLGPSGVHGRGVYAARDFKKNETVEECPFLYSDQHPIALDYCYTFGICYILPLGYGALYNHADSPNLRFFINPDSETISYIANRDINMGEELFVDYGKEWWETRTYPKISVNPSLYDRARAFRWTDLFMAGVLLFSIFVLFKGHH